MAGHERKKSEQMKIEELIAKLKEEGKSDDEIKSELELIKKIVDITILAISCYLGALAIAWGVVAFNFVCIFINLVPNVKLLDYKIQEQILDVLPTLIVSIVMGGPIIWVPMTNWSPIVQLVVIVCTGVIVYTMLCRLFKIESFMYIYGQIKPRLINMNKYNH